MNDNATNYVMLNGASEIIIANEWNQKFVKVATITTANGAITEIKQRKMDAVGGELGGGGGFKNISNCVYEGGLLVSFLADGEQFYIKYQNGNIKEVVVGEKRYTINYVGGRFKSSQES